MLSVKRIVGMRKWGALGLILLAVPCVQAEQEKEWISLFNGKDLSGWKVNENPQSIRVEDGCLITNGPCSHAFFVGPDGKADFTNFHLQAEVMTQPGANSGIYFHTKFQPDGWPEHGYEGQVNNTHGDTIKTGSLYAVAKNEQAPAQDGEWFRYEIVVRGRRIITKVNDKTITDYVEPENLDRDTPRLSHGTFALQAHDPGSKVAYRQIRVKRLPTP